MIDFNTVYFNMYKYTLACIILLNQYYVVKLHYFLLIWVAMPRVSDVFAFWVHVS